MAKPTATFIARLEHERRPLLHEADQHSAGERAVRVADAADDDCREDAENQREAEVRIHGAGRKGVEDPGQPGEPAADGPGDEHDPVSVDAGRLGELDAVGQCTRLLAQRVDRSATATSTIVAIPSSVTISSVRPILRLPS